MSIRTLSVSSGRKNVAALLVGFMVFMMPASLMAQGGADRRAAKSAAGPARWEPTIKNFERLDAKTPPPKGSVLLVGGSNARRWSDVDDYFPKHDVINRGFGGARLSDVLHFVDRVVFPYAPAIILINAGGNDLGAGKSPLQIRETAETLVAKLQSRLPKARICFLGLPVVRRASDAPQVRAVIMEMNGQLAELAAMEEDVEFIDLVPAFLDDERKFRPELFVKDGTHFSSDGYAVVADLIRGKL